MSTPAPASPGPYPIRFGDFELDARSGELRNNGSRVVIAEQPLQVLLALIERPGDLVTRDQLRQRLWPGDTFVDFEHGLNAAVKRLRDALGDSAETPRYIETVPRRGYRLIAPLENGQSLAEPPPPVLPSPDPRTRARRWWALGLAALAVLATVATVAWHYFGGYRSEPRPVTRPLTRLTFGPGLQTDVTWSLDGTRIAYASDRDGNLDIWVQSLDGGAPAAIASSPAPDSQPAWSPNGNQIVFRSERDGGGLFLVSAAGGPARRLTTFGFQPAWYPDGRQVLFIGAETGGETAVFAVVADGGATPQKRLGDFLRGGTWYSIAPRADGRIMAVGHHRTEGLGIFAVSEDGRVDGVSRPPEALTAGLGLDEPHPTVRGRWSADGSALFLEVTPNELSTVWRVPARAYVPRWSEAERLTAGPGNAIAAAVSPDGGRLAFTSDQRRTRAWVFPFDPAAGRLNGQGRPVTDADTTIGHVSFTSVDGREILYSAWRAGKRESDVMATDVTTGTSRVLVSSALAGLASPDGRETSYLLERARSASKEAESGAGMREFAAAVRDSSGSERLVSPWSGDSVVNLAGWSADARTALASYWNPYPSGAISLVLWPLDKGVAREPLRVVLSDPARAFWQAEFSPNRRFISFVAVRLDRPGVVELGIADITAPAPTRWQQIAADHPSADKPRWAPDGRTLYFVSRKPTGYYNVWGVRIDPVTGTPASEPFLVSHFDSPDLAIDPEISRSEIDIAADSVLLTMRQATGSIWMLSGVDR